MKQIIPVYSFNAAGKTITLGDFSTVRLDRILLIVNVTRNVIYYNFADATLGATVATNVITLVGASTSGHANGDKLEVFYDTVIGDPDYQVATPVSDNAGSLTVDAPVGTPAWVRLSDGSAAYVGQKAMASSLPVAIASDQSAVPVSDGSGSLTVDSSIKALYGTEAQAVSCTLTSLASSSTAGREGTVVSNLTDLFNDVLVFGIIKLTSGTPANDKRVYIWAYGTVDAATPQYPDAITGADAAITFNSPINLRLLGIIEAPAQSLTYKAGPWSLRDLFGSVPEKWGIAVQNFTGIAFTSTASDHKILYQGVNGKLV